MGLSDSCGKNNLINARVAKSFCLLSGRSIVPILIVLLLILTVMPTQSQVSTDGLSVSTYIVVFNDSPSISTTAAQTSVANFVFAHGGNVKYRYHIIDGIAVTIPDSQAGMLNSLPNVKYVEKNQYANLMLNQSIPLIGGNGVWSEGFTGDGIKVGLIDTGVNTSHPDLNNGKVIAWKDFVYTGQTTPRDLMGHGTHCAGIIAGTGNASQYNPGGPIKGVAPNASIIAAQVFDYSTGQASYADIISAIEWEVDNGAQIISMSLGGPHDPIMDNVINTTVSRGITVVVAAGNSGPGSGTIQCPGDNLNVITVGMVDKSDILDSRSSRGPNRDGSIKPDVTNIGVGVWSAYAFSPGYVQMTGTSMATPMTAGVVALMLQKNPSLTPVQVKYILEMTAKPLGTGRPNNNYGWGRVCANNSVDNATFGILQFNLSSYYVNENDGTVILNVTKTGNTVFPASVNYATANGTALDGINYQAKSGTLTFQPMDSFKTFTVNIRDDGIIGPQKYFTVDLMSPVNATLAVPVSTQVFINNSNTRASFTSNVTSGISPLTVQFNDTSLGMYTDWQWNFGDGTSNSTDRNATHTFTNAGPAAAAFTITLTASNATDSSTKQIVNYIMVNPRPPVADFMTNATEGYSPLTVQFTDASSGTVNAWQWDFGDGAGNATIKDPIHTFTNNGATNATYTVTLTVFNDGGYSTKQVAGQVKIIPQVPMANFISNRTTGNSPLTVQFTDTSMGMANAWQWDFGDGTANATIKNPVHTFSHTGNYSVMLTAYNAGGKSTIKKIDYINVTGPEQVTFNVSLVKGWNLVSFPVLPDDTNITQLIPADARSHILVIWLYNGNGTWKFWTELSGYTSTLKDIDVEHGYQIYCDAPISFNITGTLPNTDTVPTVKGDWNIVGYPRLDSINPATKYSDAIVVWGFKNNSWYFYTTLPGYTNTLTSLDPGYGYEVYK